MNKIVINKIVIKEMKDGIGCGIDASQQVCEEIRRRKFVTQSFLLGFVTGLCAGFLSLVDLECGEEGVAFVGDQIKRRVDAANEKGKRRATKRGVH